MHIVNITILFQGLFVSMMWSDSKFDTVSHLILLLWVILLCGKYLIKISFLSEMDWGWNVMVIRLDELYNKTWTNFNLN